MNTQQIFIDAGLRPTKARLAVLTVLISTRNALSHSEILEQMASQKEFDRVTIYRVLDWLTEHHLIHKISGENRAWKFQYSRNTYTHSKGSEASTDQKQLLPNAHQHAHLHCTACGAVTCIHEVKPQFPEQVLKLYHVESIDINIKGLCQHCNTSTQTH
ncbi:Fur family transcriptional regulator [Methylotenera mobilis]|uniref:Ferric uptake regulator, Fur family n=1 Tax=Methylotenera mobilis (strain JLW8 / ATCC BAA-1282 / DSM 17540) TaxID=583345 RepID=C6WWB1_METML|nr:transcriptional repressor [Methylotenera mobilis]ACT48210.1 ferric uptake regulator, Fur family [Methylotenera mobilis JLW8]